MIGANAPQIDGVVDKSTPESAETLRRDAVSADPQRPEPGRVPPSGDGSDAAAQAELRYRPRNEVSVPSEIFGDTGNLADLGDHLEAIKGILKRALASREETESAMRDAQGLLEQLQVPDRVAREALKQVLPIFGQAEDALQKAVNGIEEYAGQLGLSSTEDIGDLPHSHNGSSSLDRETSRLAETTHGPSRVEQPETLESTPGSDTPDAPIELGGDDAAAFVDWVKDPDRDNIQDSEQLRQHHPLVSRFLDALADLLVDILRDLFVHDIAALGKDRPGAVIRDHGATPGDPVDGSADGDAEPEHRREVDRLVEASREPSHAAQREALKQRIRGLGELDAEARKIAAQDLRDSATSILDDVLHEQGRRDAYRKAFSEWANDPDRDNIQDREQLRQRHPLVARFLDALGDLLMDILLEVAKEMLLEMLFPGISIILPPTDLVESIFTALTMMKIANGAA